MFLDPLEEGGGRSELVQESSINCCKSEDEERTEDHVSGISDYERIRNARMFENKVSFPLPIFSFSNGSLYLFNAYKKTFFFYFAFL